MPLVSWQRLHPDRLQHVNIKSGSVSLDSCSVQPKSLEVTWTSLYGFQLAQRQQGETSSFGLAVVHGATSTNMRAARDGVFCYSVVDKVSTNDPAEQSVCADVNI